MTRPLRIISTALITAGLVLLADIGITLVHEEPVSAVYAAVQQNQADSRLDEIEASYPSPADLRAVAELGDERRQVAALARRFRAQSTIGEPIGRIRAADIDLDTTVVQGTDTANLRTGPGHFPETPFPGEGGTVAIAGHRTTYGAPFRHVDSLSRGAEIVLEMPYATFTYRVQKTEIVDPGATEVIEDVGYERLVLTSCHPLYSATQRFIVFAKAVANRARPAPS